MAQQSNIDSGTIQPNRYKTKPNQPDYRGKVILGMDTLRQLMERAQMGIQPAIELAGWAKAGQNGNFISLSVKIYEPRQQNQRAGYQDQMLGVAVQPQQYYRQAQGYQAQPIQPVQPARQQMVQPAAQQMAPQPVQQFLPQQSVPQDFQVQGQGQEFDDDVPF